MRAWIVFTGLPIVSILGGVLGIFATFHYNFNIQQNLNLGMWSYLSITGCLMLFAMGVISWIEWRD